MYTNVSERIDLILHRFLYQISLDIKILNSIFSNVQAQMQS